MGGKQVAVKRRASVRGERLEARVSAVQKDLFQRAAELQGRTLTDFVIASVHEAAIRALEDMQAVKLTSDESRAFAEAILNPRDPSGRLKAAAHRFMAAATVAEPVRS